MVLKHRDRATKMHKSALERIEEAKRSGSHSLDLSHLSLSEIPEGVCDLKFLTELNLRGNQLTALPEEIGELKKLKKLDLRNNWLGSLGDEVFELVELSTLDLSHNNLTALPRGIGGLTWLEELNLQGNKLTTLPEEICVLKKLVELDVKSNPLKAPPEWVVDMGVKAIEEWFKHNTFMGRTISSDVDDEMGFDITALDPLNAASQRAKERQRIAEEVMAFARVAVCELDHLIGRREHYGDNGGPPIEDDDIANELECLKLLRDLLNDLIFDIEKEKSFSARFASTCDELQKSIDRSFGSNTVSRLIAGGRYLLPATVKFVVKNLRKVGHETDDLDS